MVSSYDPSIFHPQNPYTTGIELEVRLIDSESMKPRNSSPYIFHRLPRSLKPHIHKELLQSMVEVVTPVCGSAAEAADFVTKALKTLVRIGKEDGIALAALATHPFERKEDNEIVHDPRYEAFAQELQIVLKNFLISGLHIHIAMPDENAAIRAYNTSIKYLPLFVALSANSPFILGEDSGLQSYRNKIFERLPRAGIPEPFEHYRDYCRLMDQLIATETVKDIKDVWWDVRIHQRFGTVELRVCDAFYDPERLRLIAVFYQALMHYAARHPEKHEFYQIYRQNKWNAVRHGLKGGFIEGDEIMSIRQKIHKLIDKIAKSGSFAAMGSETETDALHDLTERESTARKLRRIYHESGDLKAVIREELVS